MSDLGRARTAGVVTALVGFTGSFAVVLTGLRAVGATPEQAASGLLVVSVLMGLASVWLSTRHRQPITTAWSTSGAALLAATGTVQGGWPAAVGAFAVVGVLLLLTAASSRLASLVARVPTPVAQAMLAGILLPLCTAPVTALAASPVAVAPVLLAWLVLLRLAPRWAVPGALVVAVVVVLGVLTVEGRLPGAATLVPTVELTVPALSWQAVVGLALPLYLVTMTSQNLPGAAVMRSYGYEVPWRRSIAVTGAGTLVGAAAGVHAMNLAAISAALAASPSAGEDPAVRWRASRLAGWGYVLLGVLATALAAVVSRAPEGVVETAAGLALLGTLAAALAGALTGGERLETVGVTFVVAASGVALAGIGAAFWALVAGLVVRACLPSKGPDTR